MTDGIEFFIGHIPEIFQYFVPGFIFTEIIYFSKSIQRKELKIQTIYSFICSYVITSAVRTFLGEPINSSQRYGMIGLILIMSVFLAFIFLAVMNSETLCKIMKKNGINRTLHASIWERIIDFEYGVYVCVRLENEKHVYCGNLIVYDYKPDKETYILLEEYTIYNFEGEVVTDERDNQWRVLLKLNNVDSVELFYNDKSKKILKKPLGQSEDLINVIS